MYKSLVWWCMPINPALRGRDRQIPWSSLAGQPANQKVPIPGNACCNGRGNPSPPGPGSLSFSPAESGGWYWLVSPHHGLVSLCIINAINHADSQPAGQSEWVASAFQGPERWKRQHPLKLVKWLLGTESTLLVGCGHSSWVPVRF